MSSVQSLREFVTERLTAAAEEIFRVFEQTIVEYEAEIDRQRRLLDVVWNPQIKLHRIELPLQHVYKEEEIVTDQQLCNQERNSSLDQEDPDSHQIKEEQEELCTSLELDLKQETDNVVMSPTHEENDQREPETISDQQLLPHSSTAAENQDQEGSKHVASEMKIKSKNLKKMHHKNTSHINNADVSPMSENHSNTHTGKERITCETCGKVFMFKCNFTRHLKIHTGEKLHVCNTCGKRFTQKAHLKIHLRTHTGERLHVCNNCGKRFGQKAHLKIHLRTHTGEKPYVCNTCGKRFSQKSNLEKHLRIHTSEKLHVCNTCGKRFSQKSNLEKHLRIHTSEKLHVCSTCAKRFRLKCHLKNHLRLHTAAPRVTCGTYK